jgi:protein-S-isoprenylcysteine O-methyltransferase Ste14
VSARDRPTGSVLALAYASACYLAFLGSFAYFILFLDNLFVPIGVDTGPTRPWPVALAIDLGLVLLWGLQHSIMARRRFKQAWTRIIPPHTERATYCAASAIALFIVCIGWSPLPGVAWNLGLEPVRWLLHALAAGGWLLMVVATFEIDHFGLFGLRQPYYALTGRNLADAGFRTKLVYRFVRHPIQTGIVFGMWSAPTMTASRLVFATLMTAYIFVGLAYEERDLIREFGERYRRYIHEVPKLIPWRGPKRSTTPDSE